MSQIIKPKLPLIDYSHPIAKGIVFEDQFFEGAGTNTIDDILTNPLGSIIASGATWDRHLYGIDLDFSAVASGVTYTTPSQMNSLNAISIEFLALIRGQGPSGVGRIMQKIKGATTDQTAYFELRFNNVNTINFYSGFSTTAASSAPSFTADSIWHHWVLTCSDLTNTTPNISWYKDGILFSTAVNAGSGTKPTDDTTFEIGNRGDGTRNFNGKISYVRIWNRVLSAQEAKQLYSNPWCLSKNKRNNYVPQFYN